MINNADDLRRIIGETMDRVLKKELSPTEANATANLVGKYLSSVKLEMEYNKMQNLKPNIKFMENTNPNQIEDKSNNE